MQWQIVITGTGVPAGTTLSADAKAAIAALVTKKYPGLKAMLTTDETTDLVTGTVVL